MSTVIEIAHRLKAEPSDRKCKFAEKSFLAPVKASFPLQLGDHSIINMAANTLSRRPPVSVQRRCN